MSLSRGALASASASGGGGIAARLLAVLLVVTLLLTVVTSLLEYRNEQESMREQLLSFGRSLAQKGAFACPDAVVITDEPALNALVEDFVAGEKYIVAAAVVRDSDGLLLAASPDDALEHRDESTLRIEHPILVERGGARLGTFVLGVTLAPMQAELRAKWSRMLLRTSFGFLLIASLFWIALRVIVLRPLHRLDAEARRLGSGELNQSVQDVGSTELGRLGRTLDAMRANLLENHRSLAEQNRRLVELDRLKTQFLTNVSHEMRTPLTSVLGGLELLTDADDDAIREEMFLTVRRNAERLLDLVDRLLDLSKLQDGNLLVQRAACEPEQLVIDTVDGFRAAAHAKGLTLTCEVAGLAGLQIVTDATRVRQILQNLVDNAVKFTEHGGVDVAARLVRQAGGHRLELTVQDTGPGIPQDFKARLFEAFSQADGSLTREHGGTGLGLAMARRIARCLGGDLVLENRPTGGVRALASLAVNVASKIAKADQPAPAGERILVVDDAPDNQRMLQAFLKKAGYEVHLASNGLEAVEAVAAGEFALVLMDLQMPVMDGVTAIRELRGRQCKLPIVALTAHALAVDKQGCLDAGADAYETKPIAGKRLVEVVRAQIAAKQR